MGQSSDIVVIAAHANGQVYPETYDLLAFARQLQKLQPGEIRMLVLGAAVDGIAETIAGMSGQDVEAICCEELTQYCSEGYRNFLVSELQPSPPAFICALHNSQGLDFAPAVASEINAACITGVTGLSARQSGLVFQKHVYGGKIKGNVTAATDSCVLTVQPGVFKFETDPSQPAGNVTRRTAACRLEHSQVLGTRPAEADTSTITEARVIVSAGNGVGDQENMGLIHELARLFQKSAVAGTRTVCDRGWLGYSQQIGITGATVAPELYIACGISGAVQHVMGMQGSRLVIAINTDARAAIFNEADICIVEDLTQFIPLLLETYKNEQTEPGKDV